MQGADTVCSSALVALHAAALHAAAASAGSSSGGRSLFAAASPLFTPSVSTAYARAGMLSATGRRQAFDSAADGYVRSEAAGAASSGRDLARTHLRDLAVISVLRVENGT